MEAEQHFNGTDRATLQFAKRIVIKIGSSSLLHKETGKLDFRRIDHLVREISDLKNQGKEVILVSSGAAAVGKEAMRGDAGKSDGNALTRRQACAAIGQARLMMIYQRFLEDYNQVAGQVLMTKYTVEDSLSKYNLQNTFFELLEMGILPIVNENDSVATLELQVGDNDKLSAMVASLVDADLLILLSDVEGLYSDDPRQNPEAVFIDFVPHITEDMMHLGKQSTGSSVGTGGMRTKLEAAQIATKSGCAMIIANSRDEHVLEKLMRGDTIGTLFAADPDPFFDLQTYAERLS